MKLINKTLLALFSMSLVLTACSSDDQPFSVAGPDDEPRILAPTFPDRVNGELPVVTTTSRDANFSMELTVTPADYVEVVWYLDSKEVARGKKIDMPLMAGMYTLKVVVATQQEKSTSREGFVRVNPLDSDPWASEVDFERIIAPGSQATLYGTNLDRVTSMKVGDVPVAAMSLISEEGTTRISYTVPAELPEGKYRISLIDAEGVAYGGDLVTVSSSALITSGAERTTSNAAWTLNGINLDKVASLTLGSAVVTEFTAQTASMIQFISPSLEDGEYSLTGKMKDGSAVTFYKNNQIVAETSVVVSSQQTLWSGHHYVSWDFPDDNPNKTFNLIGMDVFDSIQPGAVLSIHYSVEPSAEYHQLRTTTVWWTDLPGTGTIEFSTDGVLEVTLTQAALDLIKEQGGFICVGHGFYVDLVTLK